MRPLARAGLASVGLACAGLGSVGLSCGAAEPLASTPTSAPWASMTRDQKLSFMATAVMPRMKERFVAADPHRYARMDCTTCHGQDGAKRGWAMPNPDLLLEPTPWNTGAAPPSEAPSRFDAFMAREIAPEMNRLLGARGGTGAGCFRCHTPER